jgi:hypothetical protein
MRLQSLCLVVLSLVGIAHAQTAAASSITIAPSKDNTLIQQTSPTGQLSNGLGDIFVGRTNQDGQGPATISIRRGLIDFNVAGKLPAGATLTGVTLTLRDVMGLNGSPTVELHRALQDWGEGSSFQNGGTGAAAQNGDATWLYTFYNSVTPALSLTWATLGGSYSPTVSASTVVTDSLGAGQSFSWSSPQMVADVQSWLSNPATNFGWVILGDESQGQTAKRFNSRESTVSPNVPPMLTINFTVPEPSAIGMAATASFMLAIGSMTLRRRI